VTPRAVAALLAAAVLSTFLPARTGERRDDAPAPRSPVRVGLVFDVGGRGDKSFNDAAYAGLVRAQQELGVSVHYLEPVGAEDRESAMRLFAARGFDLVIGVGFIFSSDVDAVARAYPAVRFACVDYAPSASGIPANVAGLAFREEEGCFLVGAVAGLLTKTKHVGFVGGMAGPLIGKFEQGYARGAREVCPECRVHSGYIGPTPDAFRDPAKGKSVALTQVAAGADVLFHAAGASGHGGFEAAREGRALAIGVDSDQHDEMPGVVVTSMVKRGDVAVLEVVREVVEGRFRGGMHVLGVREGAIDYVRDGPHAEGLSAEVRARVAELESRIVSGELEIRVE